MAQGRIGRVDPSRRTQGTIAMTTNRTTNRRSAGLFADFLARRARNHALRLAERRLREMDDHLLRDLGIERDGIGAIVRTGNR